MQKVAFEQAFKTDITEGLNLLYGIVLRDDTKIGHSSDLTTYDLDAEAQKIKQSVSSHDKAIEKQLAAISKGIEKNAKAVKAKLEKAPKDQQDRVKKLAAMFDY